MRLAIDLKGEVKPNIFALTPAGEYKYRLVLDIYPLQDELMAMLGKKTTETNDIASDSTASTQPRLIIEPLPQSSIEEASQELPAIPPVAEPTISAPALPESALPESGLPNDSTNTPINKKNDRLITIAIDAGHGGEDPGARGANGSHEKVITLAIAKKLKAKIDADPTMRGVLTRDDDYFVALGMRVVKARKFKADLFVSIHDIGRGVYI